ncbi:SPASM domain-containing protein [Campylobacter sp. 2018MI35]|uniref:radical SAM/SPASM domain-containing protein n=1 Tax=Campylobacter sp. 2018MI34 TaxID=2800582 RepID=UPI0019053DD6|nr:radical SAM/SPASM domain-containing protein [Campylobacter sp. 2018MI34]MBK1991092.1 SPASM domain-containing protein [Campylobacter sp. 2018MI34]
MKFKKIYIELSDICGLKCEFCPSMKNIRGIMKLSNFKALVEEISNKAELFTFHLLGDPLLLSNLEKYIQIAYEKNMKLELTTSGFYFNTKNQNLLLKYSNIYQINISITAFLSQNKLSLKDYFEPILTFFKEHLKQNAKSFINLRLWNLDENFNFPKENLEFYQFLNSYFNTKIDPKLAKNRLARHIILHQKKSFKWPSLEDEIINTKGTCYGLIKQIGILSNGVVVPCCLDAKACINLGNIFEKSFTSIINSQKSKKIKQGFKEGKYLETLCQRCTFNVS